MSSSKDQYDLKGSDVFDFKSAKDELEEHPDMENVGGAQRIHQESMKDMRNAGATKDLRYGSNKVKVNYSESRQSDFSSIRDTQGMSLRGTVKDYPI